ncbi:MAG: hypothetical protein IKM28_06545, partial [Lachnospiraceae bacterium]|nr:hypothetical protein [Lachnospiraceae bacterium]
MSNISYHNKDIVSKILGENLKNKSLQVYGIHLPKIVDIRPTNLPVVSANELRMDNRFLLEDGTLAIIDYESTYVEKNKLKYLEYVLRVLLKSPEQTRIQIVVIYTADVEPEQTTPRLEAGCLQMEIQQGFLSQLDTEALKVNIERKIRKNEALTEEEAMQFIVLPLSVKGRELKSQLLLEMIELAEQVSDQEMQRFLLSGILVFSDKIIDDSNRERIERSLRMTQIGKAIFEDGLRQGIEQ